VPPERFWNLTARELQALRTVHRESLLRWAIERSMYANVNFLARDQRGEPTEAPWTPEDFLGEGDRRKRTDDRFQSQMAAQLANLSLLKIQKDCPPDDLPVWARG